VTPRRIARRRSQASAPIVHIKLLEGRLTVEHYAHIRRLTRHELGAVRLVVTDSTVDVEVTA
jgi:hypothetical protein